MKPIKNKRIPTADSDYLRLHLELLHQQVHTPEGLRDFDQPRRSLVEHGMKLLRISLELYSREPGYQNPCRFCDPRTVNSGTLLLLRS
jgi:hypothetical protein